MAGPPNKIGFEWFNLQCDIFDNPKVKQLMLQHPDRGFQTMLFIWCKIYGMKVHHGYFLHWSKKELSAVSADLSTPKDRVSAILETCLEENIFSRQLFERFGILTNQRIQEFFINATIKSRRKHLRIVKQWALFDPSYVQGEFENIKKPRTLPTYLVFSDIDLIYAKGELIPYWQRLATEEFIIEMPVEMPVGMKVEPPAQEEEPPDKPQVYGNPPKPPKFDWEKEKVALETDEFKYRMCYKYTIGRFEGDKFVPDFDKLHEALVEYYTWLEDDDNRQTSRGMRSHFQSWYPKRPSAHVGSNGNGKRKISNLDLPEKVDYKKMKKW